MAVPNRSSKDHEQCAHYFVEPLSWMRPELDQGRLAGRLECPKCRTNVGKYAWQGMRCSCARWIVPGISLAKGKIDEARVRARQAEADPLHLPSQNMPPVKQGTS